MDVKESNTKATSVSSSKSDSGATTQPAKTKSQLKAERRALQEAQRAAKAGNKSNQASSKSVQQQPPQRAQSEPQVKKMPASGQHRKQEAKEAPRVSTHVLQDVEKTRKKTARKLEKHNIPQRTDAQKKVGLFSHLHQYEKEVSLTRDIPFSNKSIHPATLKLGLMYSEGVICGSNARCLALLALLKKIIADYETPDDKELARDLEAKIQPNITFLQQCRQQSVSMGNAIKHIKLHITNTPADMPEQQAKDRLLEAIDNFYDEKINLAGKAISKEARKKIKNGDVILVYACSSLITRVLCEAHDSKLQFRVIVVDTRPKFEGRETLRRLVKHGIKCSYVLINAASYVMREVTKVMLGAHALLANGYVMSRVGSSQVAMVANVYNVPVLVCCETYKFVERVQTDSFVFNELGDPDEIVATGQPTTHLCDWRDMPSLRLLNLLYDVTPPNLVTSVVTELGFLPCTSVPVVLRVKQERTEAETRA